MIKVKLTTFNNEPILAQTPNLSGIWGNFEFYFNKNIDKCDYWVVFEYLPENDSTICSKENTLFITGEPSSIRRYNNKFLNQFAKIITTQRRIAKVETYYAQPGISWRSKKNYDELFNHNEIQKDKLISIIVSNKSFTPGHKKRLEFCLKLKEYFGDKIDIFGRGINEFDDKWDVLAPYKYSIAIENSAEQDYVSEKIGDCFTSLTFPFYYGCPNIDKYYNSDSYKLIDIDNFEKSCTIIEEIINNENHYNKHLNSLIDSKNKYINKYSLIPLISGFVEKNIDSNTKSEYITIKREESFDSIGMKIYKKFIPLFIKKIILKLVYIVKYLIK